MSASQVVPFTSAGVFSFGMDRSECSRLAGPPDSTRYNAGLELHEERRASIQLDFGEHDQALNCVWFLGDASVRLEGLNPFDKADLETLKERYPDTAEYGAYLHFPSLGVIVAGMGKKKLKEGRLLISASRERYKFLRWMGKV